MYGKLLIISLLLVSCEKEVIEPAKYYKEITKYSKVAKVAKVVVDEKANKKRTKKRKRRHEKINKNANVPSIRISVYSGRRNFGSDTIAIRQPNEIASK